MKVKSTLWRLALRNTSRRRARTLLTAGMVVFGVSMLLVALSWVRGAFGSILSTAASLSGHVRVVQPGFVEREELMPLDENLPELAPLIDALSRAPGVVAVEPRIVTGVTVTVGEEIGDVFAAAVGASERYFRERVNAREKLIAGTWFTGAPDEVIAGARVAELAGAKVGDELVLLGMTQDGSLSPVKAKLIGIARIGGGMLDQQLFLPLEKVQYLTDMTGATELLVYGHTYTGADALAEQLQSLPALAKLTVQSWTSREPWGSITKMVRGVQGIIVFIFVFLTALGIWNTMMMSVLERTHEIGVLRALGLSRLGTVGLFVGEALVIAVGGGLAGVGLGLYPAWLLEKNGIHIGSRTAENMQLTVSETIRGELTLETVALAFGLGLLMALVGSLVPALRAASIQPIAAMRSGR